MARTKAATSGDPVTVPYATNIVQVHVGPTGSQRVFYVHLGILSQAPSLSSMIRHDSYTIKPSISLSDVDPAIFELALRFLYTGKYQGCRYPSLIFPSLKQNDESKSPDSLLEVEMHSLLYAFAREHYIEELCALALTNIENMTQMPYLDVLDVAKKVYPKLPDADDDDAYRKKFRHETRVAMKENKNLIREPWILDVLRNEHGNLAVDLFTTLTEPLRCDDEANSGEVSPPEEQFSSSQSDKGKEENMHMNGGHAEYCSREATAAASVVEEPPFAPPEIPEASYEQVLEQPVPEPEPELWKSAKEPAEIVEHAVDDELGSSLKLSKGKKSPKPDPEPEPERHGDWSKWGTKLDPVPVDHEINSCLTATTSAKKKGKKGTKQRMTKAKAPASPPAPKPEANVDLCMVLTQ
ncbi:hypothetical protein ACJ73_04095 [Blastomyces percursus]|uniref:BTB domain-containing protein n=1 Tax=Blastomyces percursus TaxID=1658174 RepID=A0A1J9Q7W1_9EURO|nr:hypothetical protein ACJ73_04095 [Blastomyces percursus]